MKQAFKPLGIAAAVAAATSGYVNAQPMPTVPNNDLGDLALVPYYTVKEGYVTGIHITNTSEKTQVVKFRFRRATDSMDALDFIVVMSPKDVYNGFLSQRGNGNIVWQAPGDTTCVAPAVDDGVIEMPDIFRADAETGYVEIIGMAEIDVSSPIGQASKHVFSDADGNEIPGTPASCAAVRSNFLADGGLTGAPTAVTVGGVTEFVSTSGSAGVVDYDTTVQSDLLNWDGDTGNATDEVENTYQPSGNVLKVSYFIQDFDSGLEFGDNAVMVRDFIGIASMTNQEFGYLSGDLNGFDYPDLNGAGPVNRAAAVVEGDLADDAAGERFKMLRGNTVLGAANIINEWSNNESNSVDLDWVVTMPGQYTMLNVLQYTGNLGSDNAWFPTVSGGSPDENPDCPRTPKGTLTTADPSDDVSACDFRDQPVVLTFDAWNREEFKGEAADRNLVVSPSPVGTTSTTFLPKEANVITFGDGEVFGDEDANVTADLRQPFGWVSASVSSVSGSGFSQRVCTYDAADDATFPNVSAAQGAAVGATVAASLFPSVTDAYCKPVSGDVPVIGFAAWARSVSANPDANYGRIIEHSYSSM